MGTRGKGTNGLKVNYWARSALFEAHCSRALDELMKEWALDEGWGAKFARLG